MTIKMKRGDDVAEVRPSGCRKLVTVRLTRDATTRRRLQTLRRSFGFRSWDEDEHRFTVVVRVADSWPTVLESLEEQGFRREEVTA